MKQLLHLIPCVPAPVEGFEVICINGKLSISGQAHLPHKTCKGTGRKYPGLGRECPGYLDREEGRTHRFANCPCDGSGIVGNYSVEALLEACRGTAMNARVELSGSQNGPNDWRCTIWTPPHGIKVYGSGVPAQALQAALEAQGGQLMEVPK
tara:strand:- start:919 stop:1374 length:456 start_codon:yes stop_codon:yes gene_type:complete